MLFLWVTALKCHSDLENRASMGALQKRHWNMETVLDGSRADVMLPCCYLQLGGWMVLMLHFPSSFLHFDGQQDVAEESSVVQKTGDIRFGEGSHPSLQVVWQHRHLWSTWTPQLLPNCCSGSAHPPVCSHFTGILKICFSYSSSNSLTFNKSFLRNKMRKNYFLV